MWKAPFHISSITRWYEVGEGDEDNKPHQIFNSKVLGSRANVDEHATVHSITGSSTVKAVLHRHKAMSCTEDSQHGKREAPARPKVQDSSDIVQKAHVVSLLDEVLDEKFPASDPIAIGFESPKPNDFHFAKL